MKIKNYLSYILSGILLVIFLIHLVLYIVGFRFFIVSSGSMEPEIKTGSIAYVRKVSDKDEFYDRLDFETVLTFRLSNGTVVTHKVIEFDKSLYYIKTQSILPDSTEDAPISFDDVIGVVSFSIPLIGYLLMILKNWYFWVISILIIIMVIIIKSMIKVAKEK